MLFCQSRIIHLSFLQNRLHVLLQVSHHEAAEEDQLDAHALDKRDRFVQGRSIPAGPIPRARPVFVRFRYLRVIGSDPGPDLREDLCRREGVCELPVLLGKVHVVGVLSVRRDRQKAGAVWVFAFGSTEALEEAIHHRTANTWDVVGFCFLANVLRAHQSELEVPLPCVPNTRS